MGYRFADCLLDLERHELHAHGRLEPIEPQVFDVLAYLLDHRDRVVTKEELLDNIWGDRFVSESALTSRVKSARQAVGDSGRRQAVIKTIHGRGYRFVAAVDIADKGTQPADAVPGIDRTPTMVPPAPSPGRDEGRWPLLGRHDELVEIARHFAAADTGGLVLTGSAGVGKTRLAEECAALAAAEGLSVVHVNGHAEVAGITLACLAHLLPADIIPTGDFDNDLARAILFQRARSELEGRGDGRRVVMVVDDIDRTDPLSRALIGSLVSSALVFLVITQRTDDDARLALDELVRSGDLTRLDLAPLPDSILDVLLYRVLDGPIDRTTRRQLRQSSEGSPGVLQQLVESSIDRGTLVRRDDVWTLVGPLTASNDLVGLLGDRLADLGDDHRRGVELLALAGDLDFDLANELIGDEILDALDLRGMLAVDDHHDAVRVRLAIPLFAEVVLDKLGVIRVRRLKSQLTDALGRAAFVRPDDELKMARWRLETGDDVDPAQLLAMARLAIIEHDDVTAAQLVARLVEVHPSAETAQLQAEMLYRQGKMEESERLFESIDLDQLGDDARAQVIRRRATNLFYARWRFAEALELLEANVTSVSDDARRTLESHWVVLAALIGRVGDALDLGEGLLATSDGAPRLELLRGVSLARLLKGDIGGALTFIDEYFGTEATVPPGLARAGRDAAAYIEVRARLETGPLGRAEVVVQRELHRGQAAETGWMPLGAARVEIEAGRPQAALDVLSTPMLVASKIGLVRAERMMNALAARAALDLGDEQRARDEAALVTEVLDGTDGLVRHGIVEDLAIVRAGLGDPDGAITLATDAADAAGASGMTLMEAALLHVVALVGGAVAVVDRLEDVGAGLAGDLWPVRIEHTRALAGRGGDRDQIAIRYEALGYRWLANRVRNGS